MYVGAFLQLLAQADHYRRAFNWQYCQNDLPTFEEIVRRLIYLGITSGSGAAYFEDDDLRAVYLEDHHVWAVYLGGRADTDGRVRRMLTTGLHQNGLAKILTAYRAIAVSQQMSFYSSIGPLCIPGNLWDTDATLRNAFFGRGLSHATIHNYVRLKSADRVDGEVLVVLEGAPWHGVYRT